MTISGIVKCKQLRFVNGMLAFDGLVRYDNGRDFYGVDIFDLMY